jgi:N12 class adenine-specific DNA methylase
MEQTSHFNMLTCAPIEGADLKQQLDNAVNQLNAKITVHRRVKATRERQGQIEPWGKNYTYQLKDNKVYFRMGCDMKEIKTTPQQYQQYAALCDLRDVTRQLLDMQKTSVSDAELLKIRQELNDKYDSYIKNYGNINTKDTRKLFSDDADFPIICSLETLNQETGKLEKADIFYRRTVNPTIEITSVQTAEEALQISLDKRGKPDIAYMATLLDQEPDAVCKELMEKGHIFIDPEQNIPGKAFSGVVERADYLSGNVRRKLTMAQNAAQKQPDFQRNVDALQTVIPEDIRAEEISVRMGCAWIDPDDYTAFLSHLAGRREYDQRCKVTYSPITGEFDIMNAGSRKDLNQNELATYGTNDYTMYELAKKILNQRRITVLKEMPNPNDPGKTVTRTDAKASKIAIDKANQIKEEFRKWIFDDPKRKAKYERRYNDIFNSLVGREYDGSKLTFPGMASDFTLRPHQKNCVARAIYGGNTLAAHVVGAGKSAVMFTTIMKKKELGLINKACVVVPKPLTEQVANEWRRLYPDARLLTVTNDDLSTEAKRKLFTARVATGAYDAVIMSQEQFEKIPMSKAYREKFMRQEIDQLTDIISAKRAEIGGKRDYTIKQIERAKKQMEVRLAKLLDPKSKGKGKDDLLEFEQLGFDFLCVDEAHACTTRS